MRLIQVQKAGIEAMDSLRWELCMNGVLRCRQHLSFVDAPWHGIPTANGNVYTPNKFACSLHVVGRRRQVQIMHIMSQQNDEKVEMYLHILTARWPQCFKDFFMFLINCTFHLPLTHDMRHLRHAHDESNLLQINVNDKWPRAQFSLSTITDSWMVKLKNRTNCWFYFRIPQTKDFFCPANVKAKPRKQIIYVGRR